MGKPIYLCDEDSAELVVRSDDQKIDQRLAEFNAQTYPVVDLFKQRGELIAIDGNREPAQVTKDLLKAVEPLLGLSPAP
jgi:adenylate kinase family enzyme